MNNQGSVQRSKFCTTCPFLKQVKMPLDKTTLQNTVFHNLENGYIHPCHSDRKNMCTGYLAFCERKVEGGLKSLSVGRIGLYCGLINVDKIPENIEIFDNIDEMLETHNSQFLNYFD